MLWAHLPFLSAISISRGDTSHLLLELAPIAGLAAAASSPRLARGWRMALATTALVTCSSVLVHLTDGLIESHFHFFAVVAFVMLYESWLPFAICLGWVVLGHAVVGMLAAPSIYNHTAAIARPALWAVVHGGYILAASAASIVSWRFSETERRRADLLMRASAEPTYGLDLKGRIRFANQAMAQRLGTTPEQLVDARAHDLLHGRLT
ncbi:MAG TPA: hypothetical protein VMM13_07470, partial [Euzebya sp.]|nr:hypothetical protein [Euzebya sp.]